MPDNNLIGAYILGFILLLVLIKIFYTPLKVALKLCCNAFFGGLILIFINFIGEYIGLNIGVNLITSLVAGVLGMPGISLMLMLQIAL
jgi:inhibitor of the pro-sigma K processing machinery